MVLVSKGNVLVICAPSGAGKTTLVKRLLEEFQNFTFSISYTTRAPRSNEVNGRDYHFIEPQDFKEMCNEGFFAEWAHVHGNYYGTPLASTINTLESGKNVIFDVDVQGAAQLRMSLPSAVFIFIMPPSMSELERRLRHRATDAEEQMSTRLHNAVSEIYQAHWFDYIIVNDDKNVAYDQLRSAYIASTLYPRQRPHLIQSILGKL